MSFNRDIPLVGYRTAIGKKENMDALIRVIEEILAPNGINTLILSVGYNFECFPQYATGEIDREDINRIKSVCAPHGIRIVPVFGCLGHQNRKAPLYQAHPEFLETPHVPEDAKWPDIYCHHWCASNDDVYEYVFPMIDELIEVFGAEAFHCGLDEVFDIGEESCPRCAGKDKAELFARTVNILHDHLTEKGVDMMMWGDRLLDCKKLGMQMWEADRFGIHRAIDMIPKDIIICDWHYDLHDHGYYSTETFLTAGFFDVPSFGHQLDQAKHFWGFCLEDLYLSRKFKWPGKLGGVIFTNWAPLNPKEVQDMIDGANGTYTGEITTYCSASLGETIFKMAKACAQFRKVY